MGLRRGAIFAPSDGEAGPDAGIVVFIAEMTGSSLAGRGGVEVLASTVDTLGLVP